MNFEPDPSIDMFRVEARSFLGTDWVPITRGFSSRPEGRAAFELVAGILNRKSWLAPAWPAEWGGAELSPMQRLVLEEELVAADCGPVDRIAIDLAGPVIHLFGTPEQKHRYLPPMLTAKELWCQGFSEPDSGSDVNSVRARAIKEGDAYIIDGRKLWTTNAHLADMMFALVRLFVDGQLQPGLTFILIDMHDANVSVRPIRTIDGRHIVNEVSLNGVRVPASNIVGEPGRGWVNARYLLANERVLLSRVSRTRQLLVRAKLDAGRELPGESPRLLDQPAFRLRVAQAEIELAALEFTLLRALHCDRGDPHRDGLACVLKIKGADLRQRASQLALETLGDRGITLDAVHHSQTGDADPASVHEQDIIRNFLFELSASIAGGTSEIQRNIIAGMILGL